MADTAAHLVDRVLPEVPARQWVLTLPYPLRYRCAWNARLTSEVLRSFLRAVFADYRRRAKRDLGVSRGGCGSVTFIQRFGSALNLTPHFHALVLDGVYEGGANSPGRFRGLDPPETEDVARVLVGTARRILRRFERKGITMEEDPFAADDPLMAMLGAASIRSRIATGPEAGNPWRRLGDRVEPAGEEKDGVEPSASIPPRCVRSGGMSLHADVAVPARDRRRLERLCRYVARPPLALDRLEALRNGRLAYRLKMPWRDGTTHVVMERWELLERLAPLVPPPRAHQVRYHGVLAPCASGRDRVVPAAAVAGEGDRLAADPAARSALGVEPSGSTGLVSDEEASRRRFVVDAAPLGVSATRVPASSSAPIPNDERDPGSLLAKTPDPRRRTAWADLLQRVFEVDALRCPQCGGRMRILSVITEPDVARRILAWLDMPSRAPPHGSPTEGSGGSDAQLAPELPWVEDPGFDFDQSLPGDE
jgi:hypothetical protein